MDSIMNKKSYVYVMAASGGIKHLFMSLIPVSNRRVLHPTPTACRIPCAIDPDPYFSMMQDVSHTLVPKKKKRMKMTTTTTTLPLPSHYVPNRPLLYSKFFPPFQGRIGSSASISAMGPRVKGVEPSGSRHWWWNTKYGKRA